jgi:hypothetical protein
MPAFRGWGLAVASAALVVGATPAMAARDKPTGVTMNQGFRLAARQAEATLTGNNLDAAAGQIAGLQPATPLETYIAAGLRMELASRRGDPQAERKALNDMLESKAVPAGQEPYLRFLAGYFSYYLGAFDDALAQVNYAKQLGYDGVPVTMLTADTYVKMGKTADGMALIDKAMEQQRAAGKTVPASWYDRAGALAYRQKAWGEVSRWCQLKLASYPSAGNWRSCIANYMAAPGMDPQIQLDFYRLQAATGAMASERDYTGYAALAAATGFDGEAKAVLEAGKAAGKLDATNKDIPSLLKKLTPKAAKSLAGLPAAAKKAASAPNGAPAMAVGDTYFSLAQYPQAADSYKLALSKGGVDQARVNERLGIALARSGDIPGGKAALAQAGGLYANVAGFWNVWLEQQGKANAGAPPATTSAAAEAPKPVS